MEKEVRTPEQIQRYIASARDSVWVIENTIQQLADGKEANKSLKADIQRNVDHLKIVVAAEDVVASGENISDLQAGITTGEAKLAENIWPTE